MITSISVRPSRSVMSEQTLGKGGKEQRVKCFRSDIQ